MRIIGAVAMDDAGSLGVLTSDDEQANNLVLTVFCPSNLAPNKEFVLLAGREEIETFLGKALWVKPIALNAHLARKTLALDEVSQTVYLTQKEMPHELRREPHRMIAPNEIPKSAVLSEWAERYVHFAHVASSIVSDISTVPLVHHRMLALPVSPNADLIALLERFGFNDTLRNILVTGASHASPPEAQKLFVHFSGIRSRINSVCWRSRLNTCAT